MKKLSILLFFAVNCALGQSITIDPSTGNNGNININSTNGGIVIPRMTIAQRTAITNPTQGLLIYQTDGDIGFYVNRSSLAAIPNWSRLTEGENLLSRNIANNNNISTTNSGNLGIGTNTPSDKLTVQTSTNSYGISHTDGTNTVSTYVGLGAGWLGTRTAAPLYFYTNGGSAQMILNTVGNVGIGTTGPNSRLTVQAAANSLGITHTNGTITVGTHSTTTSAGFGTTTNHPLNLFTNNNTASPAFSLLTNGNVGIGNNAPTSPLTFGSGLGSKISFTGESSGTDNGIGLVSGGDLQFYLNSSGRKFLFGIGSNSSFSRGIEINPSGFLGVNLGSTSASGRVDMGSTDGNNLVLRNLNTLVSSNENHIYYRNGNHWTARISAIGTSTTEAKLSFYTGANTSPTGLLERMTILNNGNVGIGTNNPSTKLQVNGTTTINGTTSINGSTSVVGNTSISGDLQIADGTQGEGKVLVSDASGNSSWRSQAFGAVKVTRPTGGLSSYLTNDFRDGLSYPFNNTTENLDVSGNWNNTTGIYTVPETGIYEILGDVNLYSDTPNYPPGCRTSFFYQVQIVKNGTAIEKYIGNYLSDCSSLVATYSPASIISLLNLNAGDQIGFNFTTRDSYSNLYDASNPATIYLARPAVFTIKKL